MSILSQMKIQHYVIGFALIIAATYLSTKLKTMAGFIDEKEEEYELIRKFLLTDSPLYGENKVKLWIHTEYAVNSRKWASFYSRNSTDLNEPYMHLTVGSIVNHCADDFNICLIDDNSIERLVPGWKIKIAELPEPYKAIYRHIGLLKVIYFYGGILCPNSFLCVKSLKELYDEQFDEKKPKDKHVPFVFEKINKASADYTGKRKTFVPSLCFMGAVKKCPIIKEMIVRLENGLDASPEFRTNESNTVEKAGERRKKREVMLSPEGDKMDMDFVDYMRTGFHYTSECEFLGKCEKYLAELNNEGKLTILNGGLIGIKQQNGSPVMLEDLMEENYISFSRNLFGIYIPNNEILRRNKYQWFATISIEELLEKSRAIIVKFMKASMVAVENRCTTTTTRVPFKKFL